VAGEKGIVSCSTPDCGYHYDLTIAGGMKSPSLTGYCRSTKKFVRVKLKSWAGYREATPASPDCPEAILPIYDGDQVAEIPCPQCGNLTSVIKEGCYLTEDFFVPKPCLGTHMGASSSLVPYR
jgi:hypothetical protein